MFLQGALVVKESCWTVAALNGQKKDLMGDSDVMQLIYEQYL